METDYDPSTFVKTRGQTEKELKGFTRERHVLQQEVDIISVAESESGTTTSILDPVIHSETNKVETIPEEESESGATRSTPVPVTHSETNEANSPNKEDHFEDIRTENYHRVGSRKQAEKEYLDTTLSDSEDEPPASDIVHAEFTTIDTYDFEGESDGYISSRCDDGLTVVERRDPDRWKVANETRGWGIGPIRLLKVSGTIPDECSRPSYVSGTIPDECSRPSYGVSRVSQICEEDNDERRGGSCWSTSAADKYLKKEELKTFTDISSKGDLQTWSHTPTDNDFTPRVNEPHYVKVDLKTDLSKLRKLLINKLKFDEPLILISVLESKVFASTHLQQVADGLQNVADRNNIWILSTGFTSTQSSKRYQKAIRIHITHLGSISHGHNESVASKLRERMDDVSDIKLFLLVDDGTRYPGAEHTFRARFEQEILGSNNNSAMTESRNVGLHLEVGKAGLQEITNATSASFDSEAEETHYVIPRLLVQVDKRDGKREMNILENNKQFYSAVCRNVKVEHEKGIIRFRSSESTSIGQFISAMPLDKDCSSFSFEIINEGAECAIGIGVASKTHPPTQKSGWCAGSIGYHADDGGIYMKSGMPVRIKQKCKQGDFMKCTVDFDKKVLTFFKNDKRIVVIDQLLPKKMKNFHAFVGLSSEGEAVKLMEKEPWRAPFQEKQTEITERDESQVDHKEPKVERKQKNKTTHPNEEILETCEVNQLATAVPDALKKGYMNTTKQMTVDILFGREAEVRTIVDKMEQGKEFQAIKETIMPILACVLDDRNYTATAIIFNTEKSQLEAAENELDKKELFEDKEELFEDRYKREFFDMEFPKGMKNLLRNILESESESESESRRLARKDTSRLIKHSTVEAHFHSGPSLVLYPPTGMLGFTESPIAAALMAHMILKVRGKYKMDLELSSKRFFDQAEDYENIAIRLINRLDNISKCKTVEYLKTKLPYWNISCLKLAVITENQNFLGQPACQNGLTDLWMGQIDKKTPKLLGQEGQANKKTNNCMMNCLLKFKKFCTTPVVKLVSTIALHIMFILLFSYYLVVQLEPETHWLDWLLIAWVGDLFLYEIYQMFNPILPKRRETLTSLFKYYWKGKWNWLDVTAILFFFLGIVPRMILCHGCLDAARVLLSVDYTFFSWRSLHYFTFSNRLGAKVVMLQQFVTELLLFAVILLVFVMSYAVASESILYPNSELDWKLFLTLPRKAYFTIFGDSFLDDIMDESDTPCTNNPALYNNDTMPRCTTELGKYVVPVLLIPYMLLTTVLLLNLLIALFNYRFTEIKENQDTHSGFPRSQLLFEFDSKPPFPSPLFFIFAVYKIFEKLAACISKSSPCKGQDRQEEDEPLNSKTSTKEVNKILEWEFENSVLGLKEIEKEKNAETDRLTKIEKQIGEMAMMLGAMWKKQAGTA